MSFVTDLASFSELASTFEHMATDRRVDSRVVEKLNVLAQQAKQRESFWLKNRAVPRDDSFVLYHSWRNLRLVLFKMKSRVESASITHENPKVVNDSLQVIPCLVGVFGSLHYAEAGTIDESNKSELLERVRTLRSVASEASMLPSLEEELTEIDEKMLRNELAQIASAIGAELR